MSDRGQRLALGALIASALPIGNGYALSAPLLAIVLETKGHSGETIGNNAAMFPVAVLFTGWCVPLLARLLGAHALMVGAIGLAAGALLLFPVLSSLDAWFALRFVLGAGIGAHWIVSESCINLIVPPEDRGKILGVYVTVLALGIALGPSVLALVGAEGGVAFAIGAAIMGGGVFPLLFVGPRRFPLPDRGGMGPGAIGLRFPVIMLTGFASGYLEYAATNLLPVYGIRVGLPIEIAALLLTAFVAGNLVFQLPIGWLADRMNRRRVLLFCALGASLLAAAVPPTLGSAMVWAVLVAWGGLAFGLYTLGLTELGARVPANEMASANAAFVMAYQLGSLTGPMLTGRAMDYWGAAAMPGACAILALVFAAIVYSRRRQR